MTQVTSQVLLVTELFTKGRFTVPWHQRYYDWATEQVGELLIDLNEAIEERRVSYFLGSIMLVESDQEVWEINDGQQRLITLSLLIAALCRRFATRRSDAAREQRALRLLFDRSEMAVTNSDDTTRDTPRIKPPRQDESRFTQIIRGNDIGTNGKMTSAWNEIEIFVTGLSLRAARRFFDFLASNVEIGVLYVPLSEDSNAVFETLNGRGKSLDDVDLIRNHLYSYFSAPTENERRATVHDNLERILLNNRTSTRAQDYFRCYFQWRFGYLQKKRFYRETRQKIGRKTRMRGSGNYVYSLVNDLANPSLVELFRTITSKNPSPDFLSAFTKASKTPNKKRNLPILISELQGYKVAWPLVFALLRKFVETQGQNPQLRRKVAYFVHRSLSDLASFVMRVSFCEAKFEPSRFEAAFANCAMRVGNATAPEEFQVQLDLRVCDERRIMDNDRFRSQLADIELKDSRRAKRLLFGINANHDREARALDIQGCSVEHILPLSDTYHAGWPEFTGLNSDARNWVHRIGNMTLLGDSGNYAKHQFNASFTAKRSAFSDSPFAITRELSSMTDWTPEAVRSRSERLAQIASQVWSFYPLRD